MSMYQFNEVIIVKEQEMKLKKELRPDMTGATLI